MVRRLLTIIITFHFGVAGLWAQSPSHDETPRDTITIARPTWDTGWFQTEVFRLLVQDMGYPIAPAQTMQANEFYKAVENGSVDFWVNGWFPLHQPLVERQNRNNNIKTVGYEVRRGALQGYLVDIQSINQFNLQSLKQLKNPQIARHFDKNGNGKADLIGCNIDWSCHERINEHIEELGLENTVEQISGDYNPMAKEAIENFRESQKSLLLYTWTPNWTLGELAPGSDVKWLHVPVAGQETITDLEGAARNPVNLGYDLNDIRTVANAGFLKNYPDLKVLFKNVEIPLSDIQEQNARMASGEGSIDDIRGHARRWIEENKATIKNDLREAGLDFPFSNERPVLTSPTQVDTDKLPESDETIRVVTQVVEPLVTYKNREYTGFSIEVFKAIADDLGLNYSIYSVNSIAKMLDDLKRGEADVATAALGITSKRERMLEFSHPYYETGLQIMIPKKESVISTIPKAILAIFFTREVLLIFVFFFGVLLLSAHIIWLTERKNNEDFPEQYIPGIATSIWWAAVTVTTVGYGDKTPHGVPGRIFGLIWIFAGYFAFSYFTATVTSTVTLQEIEGNITEMDDLYGKNVATVENSAADFYLKENGISALTYHGVDEAVEELLAGKADAFVYDAPVLQHYVSEYGYENVDVTGKKFKEQNYGFALPRNSELRKKLNLGYLRLVESGEYQNIQERWFAR